MASRSISRSEAPGSRQSRYDDFLSTCGPIDSYRSSKSSTTPKKSQRARSFSSFDSSDSSDSGFKFSQHDGTRRNNHTRHCSDSGPPLHVPQLSPPPTAHRDSSRIKVHTTSTVLPIGIDLESQKPQVFDSKGNTELESSETRRAKSAAPFILFRVLYYLKGLVTHGRQDQNASHAASGAVDVPLTVTSSSSKTQDGKVKTDPENVNLKVPQRAHNHDSPFRFLHDLPDSSQNPHHHHASDHDSERRVRYTTYTSYGVGGHRRTQTVRYNGTASAGHAMMRRRILIMMLIFVAVALPLGIVFGTKSFSSYNFREYFVRRTKDTFRSMQNESDPEKLRSLYAEAVKESTVLKRSAIVNQLYGGWKLAVEAKETEEDPSVVHQRSDS
ncbi:hypothetical protein CVT24_003103 [Panaeolus cyanescens]|uniref:Complex 1 LYR protein domain-containing protein n=1 Tax=Panaeolus cyanescens TaxID=181874 RepID=A0A409YXS7_9AGAR|nr:hypothetical protein CVT24_003103 [Panaeolus cyanescens]